LTSFFESAVGESKKIKGMAMSKVDDFVEDFTNTLHQCDTYLDQRFNEQRDRLEAAITDLSEEDDVVAAVYGPAEDENITI
jgi:hypothetical protein